MARPVGAYSYEESQLLLPGGRQEPLQERFKNLARFFIDFWMHFGPFRLPKWLPNTLQKHPKSFQKRTSSKKREFLQNCTSPAPGAHFEGSRVPKTNPKSTKHRPKTIQKSNHVFHRCFNRFLMIFGEFWEPFGHPFGSKIS